jgi:adenylate kinase family enzyme
MLIGKRINIIGCSGSGKSTLARSLADVLPCEFIELDSLQHQENWRQATDEEFFASVAEAIKADAWVIDGNYRKMRPIAWPLVDTIIWLDYPSWTCLSRTWNRTFRRWRRKEVLWNGNREHLWRHFITRDSLFLWVIKSHHPRQILYDKLFSSPELADKQLLRFRSKAETAEWLEKVRKSVASSAVPDQDIANTVKIEV